MGDETHHRRSESYIKKEFFFSLHKIGNANGISLKMGRQWYFEDFFPCKFNQAIILLNAQRNSLLAESVKKGIKSFEYKIPSLTYFHTAYLYILQIKGLYLYRMKKLYFKNKSSKQEKNCSVT